jgi:hypothetical protein
VPEQVCVCACCASPLSCACCGADFGTTLPTRPCCGQPGLVNDTAYVCPRQRPYCVGYVHGSRFGNCSATPAPKPPPEPPTYKDTDWLFKAKRGVFTHYLDKLQGMGGANSNGNASADFNAMVDAFDAELYAESVAATGANYAIITMMQGTQHMIAPNSKFDEITGYRPGQACSHRDLVLDIHAALAKRGLRLMLYWTGDGPHLDPQAAHAMGLPNCPKQGNACAADFGTKIGGPSCCGQPGIVADATYICPKQKPHCIGYVYGNHFGWCSMSPAPPSPAPAPPPPPPAPQHGCDVPMPLLFAKRWASVLQEYSMRYGTLVSGWWIDGCYGRILNYTDRHLQMYSDAIKAGNPHAIVAFNSDGMPVTTSRDRCTGSLDQPVIDCYSRFEQFTCGESNAQLSFADVPTGRSVDGIQWHKLAYLGTYWAAGKFNPFPPLSGKPNVSAMREYSMAVAQNGGAFTLDMQLFRNGSINRAQTSFLANAWKGL